MTLTAGLEQAVTTQPGVQYTISYDISSWSYIATVTLKIGTIQGASDLLSQSITGNGSFSHNFTASGTTTWVLFWADNVAGGGFDLDNVSIPGTISIVVTEGGFAQLISGSALNWQTVRDWLYDIGFIRDPYKTPILSDLEKEYGIFPDTNLTEQERRDKLAAVKYARAGTGTIDDLQTALDRAFPDSGFTVYNNDPAQDPATVIGTNVLQDGDMEDFAVTPPWVVGNSALLTKDLAAPKNGLRNLRVRRNLVNNPYAEQDVVEIGKKYRFQGWVKSDGNAIPSLRVGGQDIWTGTAAMTDWTYFDVTATVTGSQLVRLTSVTSTGSEYTEWDDVSITESGILIVNGQIFNLYTDYLAVAGETTVLCGQPLPWPGGDPTDLGPYAGDNAGIVKNLIEYPFPTDPASWPLIFFVGGQARYYSLLLDGNMERSDVLAWTATGGAGLSKQTADPKQGTRFLRVQNPSVAGAATQTILTIGNTYRVIGWYRQADTTTAQILDGSTVLASTTSTTWTKVDFEFTATTTTFGLGKNSAGSIANFDDFQVIQTGTQLNQMEAGEALSQCGEPLAYAGAYNGQIISIDAVSVSADRQADLERLILAIKPMHSWCLLFVDYI
jgi:hypothetical protein